MKKILLSSVILLLFSVSLIIFQMSCMKPLSAQSVNQSANKILLLKSAERSISVIDSSGQTVSVNRSVAEYFLVNYDGSNITPININLPAGELNSGNGALNPEGDKLIFNATNLNTNQTYVYSVSVNGSNLTRLTNGPDYYQVAGAY